MKILIIASSAILLVAAAKAETYRLIHAIGNTEKVSAKGLTKAECEKRKKDLKIVADTTGAGGSVTCLPDSLFND